MSVDAAQLLARVGADTSDAEQKLEQMGQRVEGLGNQFGAALLKNDLIQLAGRALVSYGQTALDSYAFNERLGQSFDTLVAREIRHADATKTQTQALAEAAPKAEALLQWNEKLA